MFNNDILLLFLNWPDNLNSGKIRFEQLRDNDERVFVRNKVNRSPDKEIRYSRKSL